MEHELKESIVAIGIWMYAGTVPKEVRILSRPAKFAPSRFSDDDEIDESQPIPTTPNGLIYVIDLTQAAFATLEEAKQWADQQPWGPVRWSPI